VFIKEKIIPHIEKSMMNTSLDPIHHVLAETANVSIEIGKIQLESLKIPKINDEDVDIEGNSISVQIKECAAIIKEFEWKYTSSILEDSGKAKTCFHRATITLGLQFEIEKLVFQFEIEKLVFLHLKLVSFRLEVLDLDIILSDARRQYVYDFLLRMFSGTINKSISDKVSHLVCQHTDKKELSVPWVKALTLK